MNEIKLEVKPLLKKFEYFSKHSATGSLPSAHLSMIRGSGLEFSDFRRYTHTDDARRIDWKASLKTNETLIRNEIEERNLNIVIALDVSNSMLYASTPKLKCEYAAELTAFLVLSALQNGDAAGVVMFTDRVVKYVRPSRGTKLYFLVLHALSNPSHYGGAFSMESVIDFLMRSLGKNSIVIFVSDFIGLKPSWDQSLRVAASKFDILAALIVRDPVDNELPNGVGQVVVSDPYSGEQLVIDPDIIKEDYEMSSRERKEQVIATFTRIKTTVLEMRTDIPLITNMTRFSKMLQASTRR